MLSAPKPTFIYAQGGMNMKRITSIFVAAMTALSAAVMLPMSSASAADGKMTLELTASQRYFTENDLKNEDKVVSGSLKLHDYQECDGLRAVFLTDDAISFENERAAAVPVFEYDADPVTPKAESKDKKKTYVMMQSEIDLELGRLAPFEVKNQDGALCDYDIRIPKGTPAGVYKIAFDTEQDDFGGTYATNDGKHPELELTDTSIIVEPEALRGDTNCDGKVTIEDVKGALDYHVATNLTNLKVNESMAEGFFKTPYVHTAQSAADATQDGTINDRDAMLILRYVSAGLANLPQDWDALT